MEHLHQILTEAMRLAKESEAPRGRVLTSGDRKAIEASANPELTRARLETPFPPQLATRLFSGLGSPYVAKLIHERLQRYRGDSARPNVYDVEKLYIKLHEIKRTHGIAEMVTRHEQEMDKLF